VESVLNQFNIFCNQKYGKSNQQVLDDIHDEIIKTHSNDKIYVMFNHFKEWMLVDHPEIEYFLGKDLTQKKTMQGKSKTTNACQ
jgi:hypothetical protein